MYNNNAMEALNLHGIPGYLYSHTWVLPSVHVVLGVIFIPGFVKICLWTNRFRLTDGGRLFPSLYL